MRSTPARSLLFLSLLAVVLSFWAFPAVAAGQGREEFENEYAKVEWSTGLNKERVVAGEQFHGTLDLVSTIKKMPGGAPKMLIDLVTKLPSKGTVSYEVIARRDETGPELPLGAFKISQSLPSFREGSMLEFRDTRIPSDGSLSFSRGAPYGKYTLYVRFLEVEAKVSLFHKDITGLARDYLPERVFGSGISLAQVELVEAPQPVATPPAVIAVSPYQDAGRVPIRSVIAVTFSESVERASAEAAFAISPNVSGKFRWDGNVLVFDPNRKLSRGTTYEVKVGAGVRDLTATPLPSDFVWTFATSPPPSRWWAWAIFGTVAVGCLVYFPVAHFRRRRRRDASG